MLDGEYQFPCGCWATSGGPYWGYKCDNHTLRWEYASGFGERAP